MNFEQQQAHAEKLDEEMDRIWDILMSSKSSNIRKRCVKILNQLQHAQDCYLSGDGI